MISQPAMQIMWNPKLPPPPWHLLHQFCFWILKSFCSAPTPCLLQEFFLVIPSLYSLNLFFYVLSLLPLHSSKSATLISSLSGFNKWTNLKRLRNSKMLEIPRSILNSRNWVKCCAIALILLHLRIQWIRWKSLKSLFNH